MSETSNLSQQHSVWLRCSGDQHSLLQADVLHLTEFSGTHPFKPHVTLLGDLSRAPERTLEVCFDVLSRVGAVTLECTGVASTDAYFMSLFLELSPSAVLTEARAECAAALDVTAPSPFRPHISLAYGVRAAEIPEETHAALRQRYVGSEFNLTVLDIALSSSETPIQDWVSFNSRSLPIHS